MSSVLTCAECASFLLVRVGSPSPLDGRRALKCLACRTGLQPRRSKLLYSFIFVLAALFTIAFLAIALYKLLDDGIELSLRVFAAAGTGCWAMYLIRRAMLARVPSSLDTRAFPHQTVALTKLAVRAEAGTDRAWARALGVFLSEVLGIAGKVLSTGGGQYDAHLKIEFAFEARTATLSYSGTPSEAALAALFNEVERLPAVGTPGTAASIELWFRVRA